MAVYYRFKSAKDYDTVSVDGHFIPVGALKSSIYVSKRLNKGTPCDLVVINAQTEEEYEEDSMIPRNTAVLIKRVPVRRGLPIVATRATEESKLDLVNKEEDVHIVNNGFVGSDSSSMNPEDTEWDVFGNDIYDIPDVPLAQTSNQVQDIPPPSRVNEDSKLQAFIDTPSLDWQCQPAAGFGHGRGFGRKVNNRNFAFERTTPPPGYVCHRCNTPGHFIQNCPTNGDRNFDIKRLKPSTGIPKSMLMPTPDGSYTLPDGAAGVLKPNDAAFEKEIEGMPSTCSVSYFRPELRCPLCKEVMKDAVLTSKCCFTSFCDNCIRDYIISKSMCVCGATNVLADDLLPNKTLRDTINRMLESNTSSAGNGGSANNVQDMESHNPQAKIPSPTQSVALKGGQKPPLPPFREGDSNMQDTPAMVFDNAAARVAETEETVKAKDVPEETHESASAIEPSSQGGALLVDEEVLQQPAPSDEGKKKKQKKTRLPPSAAEMQWRMAQDLAAQNCMMPMGPPGYYPYFGMQPGIEGFVPPYAGNMPHMGFGLGPMNVPFMPQDPFGSQGFMKSFPPQRDLADIGVCFNRGPPPPVSREEFEACKAALRKQREMEIRVAEGWKLPKDLEFGREVSSSGGVSPIKQKVKPIPRLPSSEQLYKDRPKAAAASSKKRRLSSSETIASGSGKHKELSTQSNGYYEDHNSKKSSKKREATSLDYETSDDDRHFKRRPSRYEPSPPPVAAECKVEKPRHSSSNKRDRR